MARRNVPMEYSELSGLGGEPIADVQEVRASPPSPSDINKSLRRPQPVRSSPLSAPRSNRQAIYSQRPFPIASVLQGAPDVIPQEVRASPPMPSQAVPSSVVRPQPVRGAPMRAPRSAREGLRSQRPFPAAAVFQAGGMSGAPIDISGAPVMIEASNPAGLAVRPMGSLSQASNVDSSVSAKVRSQKALRASGVPVVGEYTREIREEVGGFAPKRMPKQGFMASSYFYPSPKMIIGATLTGVPLVNAQPVMGASTRPAPRFVTRAGGQGPGYQITTSPSEDRRKMLSTLMGLGAVPDAQRMADFKVFVNQSPAFKALSNIIDGVNSGVLAAVSAFATYAAGCPDNFGCSALPANIVKAAQTGNLYALQIDRDRVLGQLANDLHRKEFDLLRSILQGLTNDAAAQVYDLVRLVADAGGLDSLPVVGGKVKDIRDFLNTYVRYQIPDLLRADWIAFIYAKAMGGAKPTPEILSAMLVDPVLAQKGAYGDAIDYVREKYKAGAPVPAGAKSNLQTLIRSGGLRQLQSKLRNPRLIRGDIAKRTFEERRDQTSSSEGMSNTTMLALGVGIAALVGAGVYFASK